MNKLSQQQKDFLRLVLRSPDQGEGWRRVSKTLTPITQDMIATNPELFESETRDEHFFIRLSDRGSVLVDYL